MRKIEVEAIDVTVSGSFTGIGRVYTGPNESELTKVGEIRIAYNGDSFWTGPAINEPYQSTAITNDDRAEFESIAKDYYDGTTTSGITSKIVEE